jgi:hypothetical protein
MRCHDYWLHANKSHTYEAGPGSGAKPANRATTIAKVNRQALEFLAKGIGALGYATPAQAKPFWPEGHGPFPFNDDGTRKTARAEGGAGGSRGGVRTVPVSRGDAGAHKLALDVSDKEGEQVCGPSEHHARPG